MTTYDINITRDGRWWMVEIPAVEGLTQARRLAEANYQAKSYIAAWLDVPMSEVEIGEAHINVGEKDYESVRAELNHLREEARAIEESAATLSRTTAQALAEKGVPVRDIGDVLGVSFQRASQLVNSQS
jgi:hypothetical protein